jgi:hypothetical protein
MSNSKTDYNNSVRSDLPLGMTYNDSVDRYQTNDHSFVTYKEADWYYNYLTKTFDPTSLDLKILIDPSDLSTMFQDTAGTTPVTSSGDPVGLILDKSQGGNHLTAPNDSARPTYQRRSKNLFESSDDLTQWVQAGGATTTPTGTFLGGAPAFTVSDDSTSAYGNLTTTNYSYSGGNLTMSALVEKSSAPTSRFGMRFSVGKISGGGDFCGVTLSPDTGQAFGKWPYALLDYGSEDLGDHWRVWAVLDGSQVQTLGVFAIFPAHDGIDGTPSGNQTGSHVIAGVQLEEGTEPTAYVPTDAAGNSLSSSGDVSWLEFDGIDDYLEAPTRFGLSANPSLLAVCGMSNQNDTRYDQRFFVIGGTDEVGMLAGAVGLGGLGWRHNNGNIIFDYTELNDSRVLSLSRQSGDTYADQIAFVDGVLRSEVSLFNNTPTATGEFFRIGGYSIYHFKGRLYSFAMLEEHAPEQQLQLELWSSKRTGIKL